ncbi:hypothetical protein LUZ60_007217 [Juncus effusus]|nr:hypothetical protein LUZ60_007217 [Juncus effusus]
MRGHLNQLLFNPLTGSRFDFPIPQSENFTFGFPMYIGPDFNPNSNPNENGDIAVLYSNEDYGEDDEFYSVGLWQFAARHLTKIVEVEVPSKSIAYFQGRLFVFDGETTETRVFDATTGDEPSGIRFISMIEACGDLLGVVMKYLGVGWEFEVYYLKDGGTNSHWVKMTSGIGDRMLFFEWPFSSVGLCLKASDFEGFRGNCIYFTTFSRGEVKAGYNLCRYDLESKETQVIPNTCGFSCWFVPSLY